MVTKVDLRKRPQRLEKSGLPTGKQMCWKSSDHFDLLDNIGIVLSIIYDWDFPKNIQIFSGWWMSWNHNYDNYDWLVII